MSTYFDDFIRLNTQRIADLKRTTEDLEREIFDARVSLEHELAESELAAEPAAAQAGGGCQCPPADDYAGADTVRLTGAYLAPARTPADDPAPARCERRYHAWRTGDGGPGRARSHLCAGARR